MGKSFRISELDYFLPSERIAQQPPDQRDASRLLVVDRSTGQLSDTRFADLPDQLGRDDLLVFNDTRVVPARLALRRGTGGRLEGLFLRELAVGCWEMLLTGSRRVKPGETLAIEPLDQRVSVQLLERGRRGSWRVQVQPQKPAEKILERVGHTPLPPYLNRSKTIEPDLEARDRARYQTVYAARPGAVAAPTAGLHFTAELLDQLGRQGVNNTRVTLHVGAGTFLPIEVDDLRDHQMHAEWFELSGETAAAVAQTRSRGGRVIAVGTTSLRVLESCPDSSHHANRQVVARSGWTELFCYPPYDFKVVDALATNFHLPRSTLLALVMAFAGVELIRHAYRHAIDQGYRFYSYGDAMLIV